VGPFIEDPSFEDEGCKNPGCKPGVPTRLEIMEKSGKLIYGHGIMEKAMHFPTISGNSVLVVVKKLKF
jgi:hypothetical protein